MRVPPGALKVVALALWLSVSLHGQAPLATLSNDLLALLLGGSTDTVRAIVRGDVSAIQLVAARDGLTVRRVLDGMVVVEATVGELSALRQVAGIDGISRDALVAPFMTVSAKAMAADQARAAQPGLLGLGGYPAVSGKGVGVAVIDSGIATTHPALAGKVAAAVSFVTGDASTHDDFGHGTHIAGIIAGADTKVTSLYKGGIAPNAHLINVRVLGASGAGYTSDVIAGVQWTIANRARYGIKVVNMSLGHTQVEPCATDPLCIAVEKASAAGLVMVVSAGNSGKNAAGQEVLASITTPGVAPSAITVAAINTFGTDTPDDDAIATYSSRGPTKYELGLKPDVAAPGNKIVSLEVPGSYLAVTYPTLRVAGTNQHAYRQMSGTSMAAGMVSGGAALLLEGSALTARQVKLALQLSAGFMPAEGVLRAGVGRVNLYSARRVNSALTSLTGSIPSVTIAGRTVVASGLAVNNGQALVDAATAPVGITAINALNFLSAWLDRNVTPARITVLKGVQMVWGDQLSALQMVWGDQTPLGQQMVWGDLTPFGQQMVWGDQAFIQQMVWGDHSLAQQMVWGDQSLGQQMVWGDQSLIGQQMVWGDQTGGLQMVWGDQTSGLQMVWGDHTTGQQMVWGDANINNANQMVWGDSTRPDGQ
jgi:serine protease AprX